MTGLLLALFLFKAGFLGGYYFGVRAERRRQDESWQLQRILRGLGRRP